MVGHPIELRGARLEGAQSLADKPLVLKLNEQAFMPFVLDRLGTAAGQGELSQLDASAQTNRAGEMRLKQPIHRAFHVVLVEAFCDQPGQPRLDPEKILLAGACVRRVSGGDRQAWVRDGSRILGWRSLDGAALGDKPLWDPEPEVRRAQAQGLNGAVLKHLAAGESDRDRWLEDHAPLFTAPPEICKTFGQTFLYGFLPVTSLERSEEDPQPAAPFTDELVRERLPAFLWHDPGNQVLPPTVLELTPVDAKAPLSPAEQALMDGLSYLSQEPGLFTDDGAAPLRDELTAILAEVDEQPKPLMEILQEAYETLFRPSSNLADAGRFVRMPDSWPAISQAVEQRIVSALKGAMEARWARLSPVGARYDDLTGRYEVRCFARIDCGPECPPKTIWSPGSVRFEIVPWYEASDAPPTVIELPSLSDDFLSSIKPNVAFKVPEDIQKFMSDLKLDKLMEGEQPGTKLGLGMICGFSIPIITICAFIVLQIFLVLFHILFWWLPFIRICIPFPKIEQTSDN